MLYAAIGSVEQAAQSRDSLAQGASSPLATLLAALLVVISLTMLWAHWQGWRTTSKSQDEEHRRFWSRQYQRRMQTSAGIGLLGLAMFCGRFVERPDLFGLYWLGVLLLLLWLAISAMWDIWATRSHFARLRKKNRVEEALLQSRLQKIKAKSLTSMEDHSHDTD